MWIPNVQPYEAMLILVLAATTASDTDHVSSISFEEEAQDIKCASAGGLADAVCMEWTTGCKPGKRNLQCSMGELAAVHAQELCAGVEKASEHVEAEEISLCGSVECEAETDVMDTKFLSVRSARHRFHTAVVKLELQYLMNIKAGAGTSAGVATAGVAGDVAYAWSILAACKGSSNTTERLQQNLESPPTSCLGNRVCLDWGSCLLMLRRNNRLKTSFDSLLSHPDRTLAQLSRNFTPHGKWPLLTHHYSLWLTLVHVLYKALGAAAFRTQSGVLVAHILGYSTETALSTFDDPGWETVGLLLRSLLCGVRRLHVFLVGPNVEPIQRRFTASEGWLNVQVERGLYHHVFPGLPTPDIVLAENPGGVDGYTDEEGACRNLDHTVVHPESVTWLNSAPQGWADHLWASAPSAIPMWCSWLPTWQLLLDKRLPFFLTSMHVDEHRVLLRHFEHPMLCGLVSHSGENPFLNMALRQQLNVRRMPAGSARDYWAMAMSDNRVDLVSSPNRFLIGFRGRAVNTSFGHDCAGGAGRTTQDTKSMQLPTSESLPSILRQGHSGHQPHLGNQVEKKQVRLTDKRMCPVNRRPETRRFVVPPAGHVYRPCAELPNHPPTTYFGRMPDRSSCCFHSPRVAREARHAEVEDSATTGTFPSDLVTPI